MQVASMLSRPVSLHVLVDTAAAPLEVENIGNTSLTVGDREGAFGLYVDMAESSLEVEVSGGGIDELTEVRGGMQGVAEVSGRLVTPFMAMNSEGLLLIGGY